MFWTIVVSVGVAVSILAWLAFVVYSPSTVVPSEFSTAIWQFLSSGKEGYFARFNEVGGGRWFALEITAGAGDAVGLALRIPRATIATVDMDEIESLYESHSFEFIRQDEDNVSIAAIVPMSLRDIGDESMGVRPAYAVRLLFTALGISSSSKWRMHLGS